MELPNGFEWASVLNSGAPLDINNAGLPICIALGNGTPEGRQVALRNDAATQAVGDLVSLGRFDWWAIIGPDPFDKYMGVAVRPASAAVAGGIRLDPASD